MKKLYTIASAMMLAFSVSAAPIVIPTSDTNKFDLNQAKIENNSSFSPNVKDNGDFLNLDYFGEGDVAVFTLDNTVAATYQITFESATPQEASNADFELLDADGKSIYKENVFLPKTGETGGDWGNYELVDRLPVTPEMAKGTYTLRITMHQGIIWETFTANIRDIKFIVDKEAATTPENAIVIPTNETNKFDLNKAKIENNSSFSPTVKDNGDFLNLDYFGEGDVAVFTLDNTLDAPYQITFESATPQEASNADFELLDAAGKSIYKENVFLPKTGETGGDWGNYELVDRLPVTPKMDKGIYTLRVTLHQGIIWETYTANIRDIKFLADTSNIVDIIVSEEDADAPMYNVLGQRVNADYKGLVIRNGRKFINR